MDMNKVHTHQYTIIYKEPTPDFAYKGLYELYA